MEKGGYRPTCGHRWFLSQPCFGEALLTYSDSVGDNARLIRKAIASSAVFGGRSRRSEVIYYWIASALVGVVLNFVIMTIVPLETSILIGNALHFVLSVPLFALFVRRLHDQNRSGWWGLLLPLSLLLSIPVILTQLRGDVTEIISYKTTPLGIAAQLCGLAVLVLCLWPGTGGANRYGPDPRLEEV